MVSADVIIIVTDEVFRFVMAVVLIMFMVFSDILGSDYGFWALKTTTDQHQGFINSFATFQDGRASLGITDSGARGFKTWQI